MKKKSNYDPSIHHRRSIRLRGWDYGKPGKYFITICCQDKVCLFGEVVQGKMILNHAGKIAQECWLAIPQHYPNTTLHEFIIMPNHIHGIIEIISKNTDSNQEKNEIKGLDMDIHHGLDMAGGNMVVGNAWGNDNSPMHFIPPPCNNYNSPPNFKSPSKTIGSIVRGFKIGVTKWMRQNTNVYHVWQRDYYDDIIWDSQKYNRIAKYIVDNPSKWGKKKVIKENFLFKKIFRNHK